MDHVHRVGNIHTSSGDPSGLTQYRQTSSGIHSQLTDSLLVALHFRAYVYDLFAHGRTDSSSAISGLLKRHEAERAGATLSFIAADDSFMSGSGRFGGGDGLPNKPQGRCGGNHSRVSTSLQRCAKRLSRRRHAIILLNLVAQAYDTYRCEVEWPCKIICFSLYSTHTKAHYRCSRVVELRIRLTSCKLAPLMLGVVVQRLLLRRQR